MKRWTKDEEEMLQEMQREGKTRTEIAEALGRTEASVNSKVASIR
jgi:DNA-binding NarL/FixJ family response regulator